MGGATLAPFLIVVRTSPYSIACVLYKKVFGFMWCVRYGVSLSSRFATPFTFMFLCPRFPSAAESECLIIYTKYVCIEV